MIVKQYFTYRSLILGKNVYNPRYAFDNNLPGVPSFSYKSITGNPSIDGRYLGVVEFDDSEIQINVVEEMMWIYAYHAKTFETSLQFVKDITGDDSIIMNENNDIVFPINEPGM